MSIPFLISMAIIVQNMRRVIAGLFLFSSSIALAIPPNSHMLGDTWYCNEGFRRQGNQCNRLYVPPNAHVLGDTWYCNEGFRRQGSQCNRLYVPPNAHVLGNAWYCNEGFRRQGNQCNRLNKPEREKPDYLIEPWLRYFDFSYRPPVGEHYVDGYFRRDGTWVDAHFRTDPDDSFWNNWSSIGNVNPHTGRVGTKTPVALQAELNVRPEPEKAGFALVGVEAVEPGLVSQPTGDGVLEESEPVNLIPTIEEVLESVQETEQPLEWEIVPMRESFIEQKYKESPLKPEVVKVDETHSFEKIIAPKLKYSAEPLPDRDIKPGVVLWGMLAFFALLLIYIRFDENLKAKNKSEPKLPHRSKANRTLDTSETTNAVAAAILN